MNEVLISRHDGGKIKLIKINGVEVHAREITVTDSIDDFTLVTITILAKIIE